MTFRCIDCHGPASGLYWLKGPRNRGERRATALCATHALARQRLGGFRLGDDGTMLFEFKASEWPFTVLHGCTDARARRERKRAGDERCPCHHERHSNCPDARPCIKRQCSRLTTAHEAPACGYCAYCSAGPVELRVKWEDVRGYLDGGSIAPTPTRATDSTPKGDKTP